MDKFLLFDELTFACFCFAIETNKASGIWANNFVDLSEVTEN